MNVVLIRPLSRQRLSGAMYIVLFQCSLCAGLYISYQSRLISMKNFLVINFAATIHQNHLRLLLCQIVGYISTWLSFHFRSSGRK